MIYYIQTENEHKSTVLEVKSMNFESFSLLYPTIDTQNARFSGKDAPDIPAFVLDELGLTHVFELKNCDISDFFTILYNSFITLFSII